MHRAQHATTLGLAPQQASHPRPQPGPAHAALTSLVDTTLTAHSMSLPVFRHSLTLPKEPRPSVSTTMYCGAGQAQQAGWKRMALDRTAAVSSAAQRVRLGSPVVRGSATQGGRGSTCSDIAARVVQLEETQEGPRCTTIITTQLPVHRDPTMLRTSFRKVVPSSTPTRSLCVVLTADSCRRSMPSASEPKMLERLPCSDASSLSSSDSVVGAPLRLLLLVEEEEAESACGRRGRAATARLLSLASSGRRLGRLPCLLPATLTCLRGGGRRGEC